MAGCCGATCNRSCSHSCWQPSAGNMTHLCQSLPACCLQHQTGYTRSGQQRVGEVQGNLVQVIMLCAALPPADNMYSLATDCPAAISCAVWLHFAVHVSCAAVCAARLFTFTPVDGCVLNSCKRLLLLPLRLHDRHTKCNEDGDSDWASCHSPTVPRDTQDGLQVRVAPAQHRPQHRGGRRDTARSGWMCWRKCRQAAAMCAV